MRKQMVDRNDENREKEQGRQIVAVFIHQFQGNDGTLDQMVQKEKQDAETNDRMLFGKVNPGNDDGQQQNERWQCGPGGEQALGDFNIMQQGKARADRINKHGNVQKKNPGFGQKSFRHGEIPVLITAQQGRGGCDQPGKEYHPRNNDQEGDDRAVDFFFVVP